MLDWLERKIGWIAFPQIIKYLAIFQLALVVISLALPNTGGLLAFNWEAIQRWELWRLFSYLFATPIVSDGWSVVFTVFSALILMDMSDGLESQWGHFRTTFFFLSGWFVTLIASIAVSILANGIIPIIFSPGALFDLSILFAFATYFPRYEIRLAFFFPVPIFIIAILAGFMTLITTWMLLRVYPAVILYTFLCLSNYLVIVIPMLIYRGKRTAHKVNFQRKLSTPECFHTCDICGITDVDDDTLGFRVRADGSEICENCSKN